MTRRPFRHHHLLQMLAEYAPEKGPLDRHIARYFRSHRALGSKDRATIAETAYTLTRWAGLLDRISGPPCDWETRLNTYLSHNLEQATSDQHYPLHVRCSCPKELFLALVASHGEQRAFELSLASNSSAPTTVRANFLKTTREELLERWADSFKVRACSHSPSGITFDRKVNFYTMDEFRNGLFEVQDEASQLVAQLVAAKPGQHVLDYCSGSGGKSLALAPGLEGRGQIYLHDIRSRALQEARIRLARAGLQNAQIVPTESRTLQRLKKKMDWVLVDAPCSGTGTLRRNPDMKWRFSNEMLRRLVGQQRQIFERALSYLAPDGTIVYATCSMLSQENEQQLEHFQRTYDLQLASPPFQTLPAMGEMDGFFAAALKLNQ